MARKNPHIGSNFESWLEEAGIREDVTAAAIKEVVASLTSTPPPTRRR
jgi:antitoxin HicB